MKTAEENDYHFNKQVCFRYEEDMKSVAEDFVEALKIFLPKGTNVHVKRGKSIWKNIRVIGWWSCKGTFKGETMNKKIHSFYYKDVVL